MDKQVNIASTVVFIVSLTAACGYKGYSIVSKDNTIPIIQMDQEEICVSVKDDQEQLKKGMTVFDEKDGDITDTLTIDNITEFLEDGSRMVEYVAFDADDHIAVASRRVSYTDYTSPTFRITRPLKFSATNQEFDIFAYVYAYDCIEGDISDRISFTEDSHVKLSEAGEYAVTLSVTNSAGDTQELPINIEIYENGDMRNRPQIDLEEYVLYVKIGEKVDFASLISGMRYNDNEYKIVEEDGGFGKPVEYDEAYRVIPPDLTVNRSSFKIIDRTDMEKPGIYEVKYSLDDTSGNRGYAFLTVVVTE